MPLIHMPGRVPIQGTLRRFSPKLVKQAYKKTTWRAPDIASQVGCSVVTLYQIMNGQTASPGIDLLLRIAFILGVTIDDFCEDVPEDDEKS